MTPQSHKKWDTLNDLERESILDLAKNCAKTLGEESHAGMIGFSMVSAVVDSRSSRKG